MSGMQRNTALSTAAALTLTVAGGVSALFFTIGGTTEPTPAPTPTIVTEYVDAAGNPVADPALTSAAAAPEVVVQTEALPAPEPEALPIEAEVNEVAPAEAYESEEEHGEYEEDDDDD